MLLGLDPGHRTGYALIRADGSIVEAGSFAWGEWSELDRLFAFPVETVVLERFALYRNKAAALIGNEFEPAQVIGAVRYLAARNGGIRIHFQPASTIHATQGRLSPYASRLVSEAGGTEFDRHARDALAHVLYYSRKTKRSAPSRTTREYPTH